MFFRINEELYRRVLKLDHGIWAISFDAPSAPCYVSSGKLESYEKVPMPEEYRAAIGQEALMTLADERRLALIQPLLEDPIYVIDGKMRSAMAGRIAGENHTTKKRVLHLFYHYLARKRFSRRREGSRRENGNEKIFNRAIREYYFSAKKISLRSVYDIMVAESFMTPEGKMMEETPSWNCFQHYYYRNGFNRSIKKVISRDGLSNYQRNLRPLYGSGMRWKDKAGAYQMDATEADIYLVSRFDRSVVIGRPNIYMAVDTATQLVAGIYVGLEAGDEAVMACLANAAADKVELCKRYGISITPDQWPNTGRPEGDYNRPGPGVHWEPGRRTVCLIWDGAGGPAAVPAGREVPGGEDLRCPAAEV